MKVTVKQLAGPEGSILITSQNKVSDLKKILEQKWKIKGEHQRLVFKGKPLEDNNTIGSYGIIEGDKIFLSVKKEESRNASSSQSQPSQSRPSQSRPSQQRDNVDPITMMLHHLIPQVLEPRKKTFWDELDVLLKKHFKEEDAVKVKEQYRQNFQKNIASLSLDDIERLAAMGLEREKRTATT